MVCVAVTGEGIINDTRKKKQPAGCSVSLSCFELAPSTGDHTGPTVQQLPAKRPFGLWKFTHVTLVTAEDAEHTVYVGLIISQR